MLPPPLPCPYTLPLTSEETSRRVRALVVKTLTGSVQPAKLVAKAPARSVVKTPTKDPY
jgi:hypothetical protein